MDIRTSSFREPVDQARAWTGRLVQAEATVSGLPVRPAAQRVARRLRLAPSTLVNLLYRPPKDIGASVYETLRAAVVRLITLEIEALKNDLAAARSGRNGLGAVEVAEIEADIDRLRARLRRTHV